MRNSWGQRGRALGFRWFRRTIDSGLSWLRLPSRTHPQGWQDASGGKAEHDHRRDPPVGIGTGHAQGELGMGETGFGA